MLDFFYAGFEIHRKKYKERNIYDYYNERDLLERH